MKFWKAHRSVETVLWPGICLVSRFERIANVKIMYLLSAVWVSGDFIRTFKAMSSGVWWADFRHTPWLHVGDSCQSELQWVSNISSSVKSWIENRSFPPSKPYNITHWMIFTLSVFVFLFYRLITRLYGWEVIFACMSWPFITDSMAHKLVAKITANKYPLYKC